MIKKIMACLLYMYMFMYIGIALHEGGHAAAMFATGVPVKKITIGTGPTLYSAPCIGNTLCTVNLFPTDGVTSGVASSFDATPFHVTLFIIGAGVGTTFCVGFILLFFAGGLRMERVEKTHHHPIVKRLVTAAVLVAAVPISVVRDVYVRTRESEEPTTLLRFMGGAIVMKQRPIDAFIWVLVGVTWLNLLPIGTQDGCLLAVITLSQASVIAANIYLLFAKLMEVPVFIIVWFIIFRKIWGAPRTTPSPAP